MNNLLRTQHSIDNQIESLSSRKVISPILGLALLLFLFSPSLALAQDSVDVSIFDEGVIYNGGGGYGQYWAYQHLTTIPAGGSPGSFSRNSYDGWHEPQNSSEPIVNTSFSHLRGQTFTDEGFWFEADTIYGIKSGDGLFGFRSFVWNRGSDVSYQASPVYRPVIHRGCTASGDYNGNLHLWVVLESKTGPALYDYALNDTGNGQGNFGGERRLLTLSGNHRGLAYAQGSLWLLKQGASTIQQLNPADGSLIQSYSMNYSSTQLTGLTYQKGKWYSADSISNSVCKLVSFTQSGTTFSTTGVYDVPTAAYHGTNAPPCFLAIGVASAPTGRGTVSFDQALSMDLSSSETGSDNGSLILKRSGVSGTLTVNLQYGGTATSGIDYQALPGSVTFASGVGSVTIPVIPLADNLIEGSETIIATILPGGDDYYRDLLPYNRTRTVTIADDPKVVTASVIDGSASEPVDGATIRLSRTGSTTTDMPVAVSYAGSATTADYVQPSSTQVIPAGASYVDVVIMPKDDTISENAETVTVTVQPGTAYAVGSPNVASITISDNDPVSVSIAATDASATEGGTDNAVFTVTRSLVLATSLTVSYQTTGGTATSGVDYPAFAGTVTIPAGATSAALPPLVPIDDTTAELPETVIVSVVTGSGYSIGTASATATIYDNETPVVSISASDANGKEGGADNGKFTLTRLGLRTAALPVNLGRTGSATAGSDYTAIPSSVTIGANSNTLDVPVTVLEDTVTEADETVIATVITGTGYTIGSPSAATVTIADNETPSLTITATDATAAEQGLSTGAFTINRLGNKATALTANISFTGSSATNGTDFDTIASTLALAANTTTAIITVKPKDDTALEPSETVICTLASGTGYVVASPSVATVTIADNDTQTVSVATQTNAAEPATNGAFRFTRTGNTTGALAVTIALTTGTGYATNVTDHQPIPTTVNFLANQLTVDVPVTVIDDANYEGPELVKLTIQPQSTYVVGSPSNATVTIADNDKPTVTVSLPDGNAAEPSDTGKFRLTRTGITTLGTLAVKYIMGGSAINGTDYTQLTGTATIAQGQASVDVTLTPLPDEVIEGVETAVMTIQADAANYNLGSPIVATVSIGSSIIETFAGQGPLGATPTPIMGGQATATGLAYPNGVAVDSAGNVFIVDIDAHSVFKVTPGGVISRVAGSANAANPLSGFGGDGGQATAALLNGPQGIAVDGLGNLYIADTNNNRVRKVTPQGVISTFAGNGLTLFAGDNGQATAARVKQPSGLAVDANNNVFICDANNRVRKVTVATGVITTVVGNGTGTGSDGVIGDNGTATTASVVNPRGVAFDAAGNLYIADTGHNRVRKVTTAATITTVAGTGAAGFSGDGRSAASAQLSGPQGVAISEFGEIFIADTDNNRVRKIEGGIIKTVGGNGLEDYTGNGGQATNAAINKPTSLAFDASGNLYIADSYNSSIRRLRAGISAITWMRSDGSRPLFAFSPGVRPEIR